MDIKQNWENKIEWHQCENDVCKRKNGFKNKMHPDIDIEFIRQLLFQKDAKLLEMIESMRKQTN